ncbi:sigma 54-interacting transcriptional regulator [Clostridium estertheticum]|uniref:sigma 54-interacting transcriptional regulator n=1 Tax=Clostridium estertheticum TaxID=238834 RepID=UPI001CF5C6E2|nr:sigma 54-interacting transcriptional regulator [Clostridium estertheticum]MCB2308934.1 sigma 54-interacting transcriptional regulator [Clostridium estertheticum]MCB2347371.1 sigma 54-interacting transcriptional regulator [Clostridium estertheticum]MCB2351996.1 sigma 54-interacting transcriptional regulator [Clostridium estertheticum]WAG46359.1 sigma 54-interacting transcriptional regulator [Clostridium estertheticum]
MKINQIMNKNFHTCFLDDTIGQIVNIIRNKKINFMIVTDKNDRYKGIVEFQDILPYISNYEMKSEETILKIAKVIKSIGEDEDAFEVKRIEIQTNIIPVIDKEDRAVGYINLYSLIKNINKLSLSNEKNYLTNKSNSKYSIKYSIGDFIGESKPTLLLKKQILAAAKTKATILIVGETGTGKELVAHAITSLSKRRHQPFVSINCAAIPDNLLESELFGYEEGSFTGAIKGGSYGKFFQANNGTIFLDEIGDMPLRLQAKILRVLQEKEIERIGGSNPIPIDVRIISATHADLPRMVSENRFRKDLFYRLHVIPIKVPPLRERKEDIHMLVEHFIDKLSRESELEKPRVEKSFMKLLIEYDWPGNVRELVNMLEMAISFSDGIVTGELIQDYLDTNREQDKMENNMTELRPNTSNIEREKIIETIDKYKGNKIKAAKELAISRSNLYYKMKKYDI